MQLNNHVIIPVPCQGLSGMAHRDSQPSSPCKSLSKTSSHRDEITWKKSLSAFKKFKGKKDKEAKSIKNSHSEIQFLQQNYEDQIVNTNFSLVDNDIKFSLLNTQNQQHFDIQETFDYFDPNCAPFFEYGISYQYVKGDGRVQFIEQKQGYLKLPKKAESATLKKEIIKKQKFNTENLQNVNMAKHQKGIGPQGLISSKRQQFEDPFIIIKATQKRQVLQSAIKNQCYKREQCRKTKFIKKSFNGHPKAAILNPRSNYSSQYSIDEEKIQEKSHSQSDEVCNDYGSDELPLIEFDLGRHIKGQIGNEQKEQNVLDNLPIYEIRDNSQVLARLNQSVKVSTLLQEYEFNQYQINDQPQIKSQIQNGSVNT